MMRIGVQKINEGPDASSNGLGHGALGFVQQSGLRQRSPCHIAIGAFAALFTTVAFCPSAFAQNSNLSEHDRAVKAESDRNTAYHNNADDHPKSDPAGNAAIANNIANSFRSPQAARAYEAWVIEDNARWQARIAAAAEIKRKQTEINAAADKVAIREQIAANAPIRLAAIQELVGHPVPRPAPGSFTECDRLASARYDTTRPLGLEGVLDGNINGGLAVPACIAELQLNPGSVRAKFELGRSLLATSRCAEGYKDLWEAKQQGSSAAAYAMSFAASDACHLTTPYDIDLKAAAEGGNGDAFRYLAIDKYNTINRNVSNWSADRFVEEQKSLYALVGGGIRAFRPRAEAGDDYAIYSMALLSTLYVTKGHPLSDDERKQWVFRCIARQNPDCEPFESIGWERRIEGD